MGGEKELLAKMLVQDPAMTPNEVAFKSGQAMLGLNNPAASQRSVMSNAVKAERSRQFGNWNFQDVASFEQHIDQVDADQNTQANLPLVGAVSLAQQQEQVSFVILLLLLN